MPRLRKRPSRSLDANSRLSLLALCLIVIVVGYGASVLADG